MIHKTTRGYIVGYLRKIWRWSPERKAVKDKFDRCVKCDKKKELFIDHIEPVADPNSPDPWSTTVFDCMCEICQWLRRLFVDASGLQALCKDCHQKKTNTENAIRKIVKNKLKPKARAKRGR